MAPHECSMCSREFDTGDEIDEHFAEAQHWLDPGYEVAQARFRLSIAERTLERALIGVRDAELQVQHLESRQ